jgi:hypothetical protein
MKYTTIYLFFLVLISLGLYTSLPGIFGMFGLVGFIIFNGYLLSSHKYFNFSAWNIFWNSIITSLAILILHSAIYFIYKSTPLSILITFLIIAITTLAIQKQKNNLKIKIPKIRFQIWDILAILIFIAQAILFLKIRSNATTETLGSPWLLFSYKFFLLYFATTALTLFYQLKTKSNLLSLLTIISQFFITFNIATIIYTIGFGYDPFLHRAAEKHIFEFGFAEPKTPFYLGQYAIVNILAHVTNISIKAIDIFITPLIASILIPISAFFGLKHGLDIKNNLARFGALLILAYPLNTMIVTTPHNFSTIFILCTIFLSLLILKNKKNWLLPTIFSIMSVAIHPLAGIFAIWLVFGILISHHKKNKILIPIYFLLGIFLIPIFFFTYKIIGGVDITLVYNIESFIKLFKEPYYFINRPSSLLIESIYVYRLFVPIMISLVALIILIIKKRFFIPALLSLIIFFNAFFITTFIKFSQLNNFEQTQYAERLLHITIFFLLPLFIFGILKLLSLPAGRQENKKCLFNIITTVLISIFITTSFYLTYPQRNTKVHFPGYNVTQADIDAVKYIHNNSENKNYIVLSNIITAAASIETYGFLKYYNTEKGEVFYYSVPSGSPTAKLYAKMLYEGQKHEYMEEAMALTNTDISYFVLSSFWHKSAEIAEGAKATADDWTVIGNNEIWIFEYKKMTPNK